MIQTHGLNCNQRGGLRYQIEKELSGRASPCEIRRSVDLLLVGESDFFFIHVHVIQFQYLILFVVQKLNKPQSQQLQAAPGLAGLSAP